MEPLPSSHSLKAQPINILISLKTKIWMTVLGVVVMFAFFILYYFPAKQEAFLLKNYNKEIQNLASTVSLGVKIALTKQDFEGVKTAMDFVKTHQNMEFVSLVQFDTVWNAQHTRYAIHPQLFKTYPEDAVVQLNVRSNAMLIVKRSDFTTPAMSGQIILGFNTLEILNSKRQIRQTSLLVSGIVFIIGILMGFILARSISAPVMRLRDAAYRVSEGDLTQRVSNISRDEIGELGLAFNEMVSNLDITQKELTAQRDQMTETLKELRSTQRQLVQSEKLASLGELTAGIAHEIQNPLNFVNNFSDVSIELAEEMEQDVVNGNNEEAILLAANIKKNLSKILDHGRRADRIVKNMLLHSQVNAKDKQLTDINSLTDEYLGLSYHGLRSRDKSFNANIVKNYDSIPKINIIPQEIGRVLLNLFNNSFYAIQQRQKTEGPEYRPEVKVTTVLNGMYVLIRIWDNGVGIPALIMDKILQPFFTTKPAGQGTGLGLSLSRDIIVNGHGGMLNVNSEEGKYTEFVITLPLNL
jgi:two-component system NtrC family sensor kinase